MSWLEIITNFLWTVIVVIVGFFEYRFGKKEGRLEAYAEGHLHGREDAFRELGVPVKRTDSNTLVVDVSGLVERELSMRSRGKLS